MKCFPFLKICGSQLESVDKRHANLICVPDEVFRNARSIEECFLDANQIKDLPKNFFRLTKIKVLTLSDNELSYIPESIGNFNHLVELDISRNHIEDIHYNIKFCNELKTLDLSNNPISRLPEGFSSLRNLTYLSLNDISLTELPNDFGSLSFLTKLELRDNCLKALPNSFSRLQHLELIDLGGNELQEFPKPLGLLSQLKVLCLDNNELSCLPQEIGSLRNLQQLDVSENFLELICQEIGNLQSVTDLVLSKNSIDSLPNNIGNMKELTVLKLDQNKLISLTSHIGNCSNLQELYLTENLLSKLPGTMGKLSMLTHLNVDRNNLLAIPPELTRCSKLSIMSFRDNHLRNLPDEIGNMLKLHVLDVSLNQLDRLPLSIAQCPLKALWLSEIQSLSIVKLQRDTDENTGEDFLTCYLLPQSFTEYDINQENSIHDVAYRNDERLSDALSAVVGDNDSVNLRVLSSTSDSKVRFTDDEQVPSNRVSKELPKTRHPKFNKKTVDGHIIPKDLHSTKETKLVLSRLNSETDQTDSKLNGKVVPIRTKKVSAPPGMAPNFSSRLSEHSSYSTDESHQKLRSHSDVGIKASGIVPIVEDTTQKEYSGTLSSNSSYSDHSNAKATDNIPLIDGKKEMDMKQMQFQPKANFGGNIENAHSFQSNIYTDASPKSVITLQSNNREEVNTSVGLIGFSENIEQNEEDADSKLMRKDTPHYTKKAKVQEVITDGAKNEDVVKQIIDKIKSPANIAPMDNIEKTEQYIQIRHSDSLHQSPTYDQVVSGSALARGSDVPFGLSSATSESEEIYIIIQKQPGEPLGMSIAGGKGSSPFQPVFVSRITETGASNRCGVRVNDKILEVNGKSLMEVDHEVAVSALKNAGDNIELLVLREVVVVPPPLSASFNASDNYHTMHNQNTEEQVDVKFQTIKCDLVRDENGLGFSIAGGKGSMKKDVCDQRWAFLESIYICKITPNGAADKCQMLQVGDKIIKINGIDVSEARHDQAVVFLSGSESIINLEVQRQLILSKSTNEGNEHAGPSKLVSPDSENSSVCTGSFRDRETIKIIKGGGQLGLSICGGSDHYSHPFGLDEPGIFVSKIASNGAAKTCGKLRVGDRIVSVNGNDITKSTHDEAIFYILQAANELILEIIHETPPPGLKKLFIVKEINENLGIIIHGGSDERSINPDDQRDEGIFITHILPDSAVIKDGRLKVGDRLIEVNGRTFMGVTCRSANKVLKEVSTHMEMLICDGISSDKIDKNLTLTIAAPELHSPSPNSSKLKYSPVSTQQNVHINNSVSSQSPSDIAQTNNCNNYPFHNQPAMSSISNEEQHLSFRSKRRFFEKEIDSRKN